MLLEWIGRRVTSWGLQALCASRLGVAWLRLWHCRSYVWRLGSARQWRGGLSNRFCAYGLAAGLRRSMRGLVFELNMELARWDTRLEIEHLRQQTPRHDAARPHLCLYSSRYIRYPHCQDCDQYIVLIHRTDHLRVLHKSYRKQPDKSRDTSSEQRSRECLIWRVQSMCDKEVRCKRKGERQR